MKIVLNKINNLDNFFDSINRCDDSVCAVFPDGEKLDMKSGFGQYMFAQAIFNNGAYQDVTLSIKDEDDKAWLNSLYGSKKSRGSNIFKFF